MFKIKEYQYKCWICYLKTIIWLTLEAKLVVFSHFAVFNIFVKQHINIFKISFHTLEKGSRFLLKIFKVENVWSILEVVLITGFGKTAKLFSPGKRSKDTSIIPVILHYFIKIQNWKNGHINDEKSSLFSKRNNLSR